MIRFVSACLGGFALSIAAWLIGLGFGASTNFGELFLGFTLLTFMFDMLFGG